MHDSLSLSLFGSHALLVRSTNVIVEDAWLWPAPEQFAHADVLVFYYWNRDWNEDKLHEIDDFLARGKGIVLLHSATIGNPVVEQLAERMGLASDSVKTKYLHTPIDLKIAATNNPIMCGISAVAMVRPLGRRVILYIVKTLKR